MALFPKKIAHNWNNVDSTSTRDAILLDFCLKNLYTYSIVNIQEIQLTKSFCVLFSDSHTNLANIKKLQELYPNELLLSLGDLTFLWAKKGDKYNAASIQYFIDNKIPALFGNHEQVIINESRFIHDINNEQLKFVKNLPLGFKLVFPSGKNILLFHNSNKDLWGFYDKLSQEEFLRHYPIDKDTLFVCRGHHHFNSVLDYPAINSKLYTIGHLCGSDHHSKKNNGGNYALLTEDGIKFGKI